MRKKIKPQVIISWLGVIIWMTVIFVFSAQDATESSGTSTEFTVRILKVFISSVSHTDIHFMAETLDFAVRKLAHFGVYFVLGILVRNAFSYCNVRRKSGLSAVLCLAYSITDEVHQLFVPGRACRIFDVVIDTAGGISGILIYVLIVCVFMQKINNRQSCK